jgi:Holliday junction resolvase RusA-like endonuclease
MTALAFTVRGNPVPQGSKRIGRLGGKAGGRPIILDANDKTLAPWRSAMTEAAKTARHRLGWGPFTGPVAIDLTFTVERPNSHFRGDGSLTPSARIAPSIRPDLDKYVRAALDAITESGAWEDDGQVCHISARKVYGRRPGVDVQVAAVVEVSP